MGGELATGIAPNVNARVGLNTLDFDYDGEIEDNEYDIGLDFVSVKPLRSRHSYRTSS